MTLAGFWEPDEDPADVQAAFAAAEKHTTSSPRCSCCNRRVRPLDADGRCVHCGPSRCRCHVDDQPCALNPPA